MAWSWVGLYTLAPPVVLFAVSLAIAVRTRTRWEKWMSW